MRREGRCSLFARMNFVVTREPIIFTCHPDQGSYPSGGTCGFRCRHNGLHSLRFALTSSGSVHFVIFPRKIPARASGVNFQLRRHARKIVAWNVGTKDGRKVQNGGAALGLKLLQLVVIHRSVGGAEIDGSFRDLLDPAARADRLIVDLSVLVNLAVFVEPLRIHRVKECGPRAGQGDLGGGHADHRQRGAQRHQQPSFGVHVLFHPFVAEAVLNSVRGGRKKVFYRFDTSSMLELSNRTQQDSGDDLMTVPRNPRHAAPSHGAKENRSPMASLRVGAGVVLVLLLPSCGFMDQISTASLHSRKDLARELIPAGSVITADPDWAIETWSGRKAYTSRPHSVRLNIAPGRSGSLARTGTVTRRPASRLSLRDCFRQSNKSWTLASTPEAPREFA